MEQPHFRNIIISGDIGTGASTLANKLAAQLGWEVKSTGAFIRQWFKEHNLPIEEANKIPEEIDRDIDSKFQSQMRQAEHIIFESHLGGWLSQGIDGLFRILCCADFEVRLERVMKRDRMSKDETVFKIRQRSRLLAEKFLKLYGVKNSFQPDYFDLVVDTSKLSADEVFNLVSRTILSKS